MITELDILAGKNLPAVSSHVSFRSRRFKRNHGLITYTLPYRCRSHDSQILSGMLLSQAAELAREFDLSAADVAYTTRHLVKQLSRSSAMTRIKQRD